MNKKVILAYSGGLDTTTIIPWLINTYDYEVIAVCVDVGQENELEGLEERALASGASKLYIEDVTDEFIEDFCWPALKADAIYEAAAARLRPILMTSLATIFGAFPIAFALGAGAQSRVPLGIVVVGGLLFALILTLVVIPVMYLMVSSKKLIEIKEAPAPDKAQHMDSHEETTPEKH